MDVWYFITLAGEARIWLLISALIAILYVVGVLRRNEYTKKCTAVFLVSVWLTVGLVFILKGFIPVERPCIPCVSGAEGCNPYCPTDSSFPSGHSAIIFSVFSSLYLCAKKRKFIPLFIVPFLVSASRYVLGVHSPIDIVAGGILGAGVSLFAFFLYEKKLRFYI